VSLTTDRMVWDEELERLALDVADTFGDEALRVRCTGRCEQRTRRVDPGVPAAWCSARDKWSPRFVTSSSSCFDRTRST
jgi:hypothetical protein